MAAYRRQAQRQLRIANGLKAQALLARGWTWRQMCDELKCSRNYLARSIAEARAVRADPLME